jgi:hypothetical protein
MGMSDHTDDRRAALRQKLYGVTGVAYMDSKEADVDAIMQLFDAECAERERIARINELTMLDNAYDEVTPDRFHEYYLNRVSALKSGAAGKEAAQ